MIKLENVTKEYSNGTIAIKNISFKIDQGEFAFLIGSSGAGKSSIIKLLFREEKATQGDVIVNGYELNKLMRKEIPMLRRSMGIVFQDFRLLPDRNIYDNVAYSMHITEATPRRIRKQVPMALALVGLSRKSDSYPHELSGGEQQRVGLARALINNPSLIIADEPTGNLDPESSFEIMDLLDEINQRGTTVLVITHEKNIVDRMQKRVIEIDNGTIIRDEKKGLYKNENSDN
ncbi:MAG TPA: cell division ATP-binding protein FtsE [Clostridia bacterium]|nr:cell division ATP-binding protein FtsE [Clostridia bacterium]